LDIPIPTFNAEELRTPRTAGSVLITPGGSVTLMSQLAELDDSAQMWERAIKKDGKAEQVADNLHIPGQQKTVVRQESAIEEEIPKSAFGTLIELTKSKRKKTGINDHKITAEEYKERFQERLAVKELVMDFWEDEMAATAAKAKAKSKTIIKRSKKSKMPDKRYPLTWSRYNSETRGERCISAGAGDEIEVKDFAVLGHKEDGDIIWCLEHDDDGHHAEIDEVRKGFRDKVGDRIKHKAYKFDTGDEQSQQTAGRRGSLTIAGELEYPELEVLPFTLRTEEQIEADIHAEEEAERVKQEKEESEKRLHIPKLSIRHGHKANDGSMDMDEMVVSETEVSIADPRFYDDCVIHPILEMTQKEETVRSQTVNATVAEKKNKYRTWSGKDWEGYLDTAGGLGSSRRSRYVSMCTMVLRKSTDDHFVEFENMERRERESVLSVAEVAWGHEQ